MQNHLIGTDRWVQHWLLIFSPERFVGSLVVREAWETLLQGIYWNFEGFFFIDMTISMWEGYFYIVVYQICCQLIWRLEASNSGFPLRCLEGNYLAQMLVGWASGSACGRWDTAVSVLPGNPQSSFDCSGSPWSVLYTPSAWMQRIASVCMSSSDAPVHCAWVCSLRKLCKKNVCIGLPCKRDVKTAIANSYTQLHTASGFAAAMRTHWSSTPLCAGASCVLTCFPSRNLWAV